jgi:hypothetical protein
MKKLRDNEIILTKLRIFLSSHIASPPYTLSVIALYYYLAVTISVDNK